MGTPKRMNPEWRRPRRLTSRRQQQQRIKVTTKPMLAKITPYVIPRPSRTGMGSRTFVIAQTPLPQSAVLFSNPMQRRHSLHSMAWIFVQSFSSSSLSGSQVSRQAPPSIHSPYA